MENGYIITIFMVGYILGVCAVVVTYNAAKIFSCSFGG